MSSHMSRQAMFPKPEQILSPTPSPIILNKAMGSFARREVITPMVNSRTASPPDYRVRPVQVYLVVHSDMRYVERFAIDRRQTKTKAITLANHNRRKQRKEPIGI